LILADHLKIQFNKKVGNKYLNNRVSNQEVILEQLRPQGIKLSFLDNKLKAERDSIYKINPANILWNEDGDSWTKDNSDSFKSDLPKERVNKYGR
jgi:hypothetical protein